MDVDKDGRLKPSEILEALRDKLPQAEVRHSHRAAGQGCREGLAGLLGSGVGVARIKFEGPSALLRSIVWACKTCSGESAKRYSPLAKQS
jgi:hypothetical protein